MSGPGVLVMKQVWRQPSACRTGRAARRGEVEVTRVDPRSGERGDSSEPYVESAVVPDALFSTEPDPDLDARVNAVLEDAVNRCA